ncbi:MAG: zinc-binding alcohol dehydrogenase [Alphaproteobacteria bacterium]|nr:zinc-binding alcohol dehydrogenase [Alphaproteobacteria bacterium SS10]
MWYQPDGSVAVKESHLNAGEVLLKARYSGISRGTERLVLNNQVPASEHERMRCLHQEGAFGEAVKYGYCMVAECVEGPDNLVGQHGFLLHPHQTTIRVAANNLNPLPPGLPPRRACLTANMETALNILWDSGASAGDRITVVGGGVVGLLVLSLASQLPGAEVSLVDVNTDRANMAKLFGAAFATPDDALGGQDVVIHTSGVPAGLETALSLAGKEARVVEASWYGDKAVPITLGGAFHSQRLQIVSSQVGSLPPGRAPRWDYSRRIAKAMSLLLDERFDSLITGDLLFDAAPNELPQLLTGDTAGLMTVIDYGS